MIVLSVTQFRFLTWLFEVVTGKVCLRRVANPKQMLQPILVIYWISEWLGRMDKLCYNYLFIRLVFGRIHFDLETKVQTDCRTTARVIATGTNTKEG